MSKKLDKCLDPNVTFPKLLMEDIIEAIPYTKLARLEKYRKTVLKDLPGLDFKEIFNMSQLGCPDGGCELGFKDPFSFASGAPIHLFTDVENNYSSVAARFVASKELFSAFATKPSIEDPSEKRAYDALYARHIGDGARWLWRSKLGFTVPSEVMNIACKVYGAKTAKKLASNQYTLLGLDHNKLISYDERGVPFLSAVRTEAETCAILEEHGKHLNKGNVQNVYSTYFGWLKSDIRQALQTTISIEVMARVATLISKRISACKKQIKETPELQEQLKSELMVNKTNRALAVLTTLNELKQAIDAVVSGISKDTLSKSSVEVLERNIYSARSDIRTIVRDLNKHYIKELPSYLKNE